MKQTLSTRARAREFPGSVAAAKGHDRWVVSPTDAVVIVTGDSPGPGQEIARAAAHHGCAVVLVYLHDQSAAEAAVDDIVTANGTAVAVRADLTDDMDVERLFQETAAMFGGADLIVHTAPCGSPLIDRQAARQLHRGGAIVHIGHLAPVESSLAGELRDRSITIEGLLPNADLVVSGAGIGPQAAVFDRWLVRHWLVEGGLQGFDQ
jgi:3-oxoacyl-[acyl-carrier protein] reductase